jgi:hypothetical protein
MAGADALDVGDGVGVGTVVGVAIGVGIWVAVAVAVGDDVATAEDDAEALACIVGEAVGPAEGDALELAEGEAVGGAGFGPTVAPPLHPASNRKIEIAIGERRALRITAEYTFATRRTRLTPL